jgi:hypothetical protein
MTEIETFKANIAEFEAAYHTLFTIAETYPENLRTQAGACGTWSAQDVLAHLAGWIVESLRRYPRYALGTADMHYNKDAFNEVSIWLRRDRDYETILSELREVAAKLAQMAQTIAEAQLKRDSRYAEWLTTLTHEAHEHATQLEEFAR